MAVAAAHATAAACRHCRQQWPASSNLLLHCPFLPCPPHLQLLWAIDLRQALEAGPGSSAPPPGATVASLEHSPELDALCLALSTGELLLLSSGASSGSTGGSRDRQPEVEEVGAVDGGLAAAAWSPDGELLALVSGTGSLLLMNRVGGCRPRRGTCCPHACLLGRTLLHC